jgi:Polyketide cyclase / dehydrase and lipid transport
MIKMSGSVCVDAPAAAVWEQLAKLEDIKLWAEPIRRATCAGGPSHGVGAQRRCELAGNIVVEERWTAWDEGRSFRYEGYGIPLVKRASNTWTVSPHGARQTLLTSEAEIELKGGLVGKLLEPLMGLAMRRMAPNSLAAFKYLVENGRPYEGKHSTLPRAAVSC